MYNCYYVITRSSVFKLISGPQSRPGVKWFSLFLSDPGLSILNQS